MSRLERARTADLLAQQERRILRAILSFMVAVRSSKVSQEIRTHLEQSNLQAAQGVVEEHIAALGTVIPQAFVDTAHQEVVGQAKYHGRPALAKAVSSGPTLGFDPSNPRAAQLMRASKLQFVQQFTNSQRDTTRQVLANAFARGEGPREAARAFRDSVGLTNTQLAAVESYRSALERNSVEALKREIRDRRFDPSIQRAIDLDEPLSEDRIDRMVERYRERFLQYRAENIARTEALTVVSQARHEATEQILEQMDIPRDRVRRTWVATKDKRTRDSHREMDGQTVGFDEPFISGLGNKLMYPGDESAPPEDRINCRCTVITEVLEEEDREAA